MYLTGKSWQSRKGIYHVRDHEHSERNVCVWTDDALGIQDLEIERLRSGIVLESPVKQESHLCWVGRLAAKHLELAQVARMRLVEFPKRN
jgi:hypothetical protein